MFLGERSEHLPEGLISCGKCNFPFFNIFLFGGTLLQELWIRKGGSKGGFRYYSTSFGPFFFRLFLLCCLPQWIIAKSSARIATIMFEFPP